LLERITHTAFSSFTAIIALFILTRLMGKKQIAQLNFFDYVIGITIGSIASEYAVVRNIRIEEGITALVVVTFFSFVFSHISLKSYKGRKILDGVPLTLIENGRIIEKNLRKVKLSVNDLLEECRQKDFFDISQIEFGILETSGRLSVQPKSQNRPLTPNDLQIPTEYEGLCTNVIIDGKIIEEHLSAVQLDTDWLYKELSDNGISSACVLLAYVDTMGRLHTHLKNK
jgi:uncharacterized membrane protein YcaP (DUF421 family)